MSEDESRSTQPWTRILTRSANRIFFKRRSDDRLSTIDCGLGNRFAELLPNFELECLMLQHSSCRIPLQDHQSTGSRVIVLIIVIVIVIVIVNRKSYRDSNRNRNRNRKKVIVKVKVKVKVKVI